VIGVFTWKARLKLGEYADSFVRRYWWSARLGADGYMRDPGINIMCEKDGVEAHGWR